LNQENEKLLKKLELVERGKGGGGSSLELADTAKRLKKRELECQALWDSIKDMYKSDQKIYDINSLMGIMKKRSLDSKAARKLEI
jgi:predicted MarR family transcription regulator